MSCCSWLWCENEDLLDFPWIIARSVDDRLVHERRDAPLVEMMERPICQLERDFTVPVRESVTHRQAALRQHPYTTMFCQWARRIRASMCGTECRHGKNNQSARDGHLSFVALNAIYVNTESKVVDTHRKEVNEHIREKVLGCSAVVSAEKPCQLVTTTGRRKPRRLRSQSALWLFRKSCINRDKVLGSNVSLRSSIGEKSRQNGRRSQKQTNRITDSSRIRGDQKTCFRGGPVLISPCCRFAMPVAPVRMRIHASITNSLQTMNRVERRQLISSRRRVSFLPSQSAIVGPHWHWLTSQLLAANRRVTMQDEPSMPLLILQMFGRWCVGRHCGAWLISFRRGREPLPERQRNRSRELGMFAAYATLFACTCHLSWPSLANNNS